jgi:hypothetical protein
VSSLKSCFSFFGLRLHAAQPRSCGGERLRTGSNSVSEELAGHRTLSTAYLQIEAVVETKSGFSDKVGRLSRRWQAAVSGRSSEKKRERIAGGPRSKFAIATHFFSTMR